MCQMIIYTHMLRKQINFPEIQWNFQMHCGQHCINGKSEAIEFNTRVLDWGQILDTNGNKQKNRTNILIGGSWKNFKK